jgi:predicted CoA-binding protein
MNKKTLILGASINPERYAYLAAHRLVENGHSIVNVGLKAGVVAGVPIELAHEVYSDIDTITLYLGPDTRERIIIIYYKRSLSELFLIQVLKTQTWKNCSN